MFLDRNKIPASSIAEVVIAVAVIALCFGIASLVFVRSMRSTVNFQDVRKQTEIQSEIWKNIYRLHSDLEAPEGVYIEEEASENDSLKTLLFKGSDEKIIWKQDWFVHE